MFDKESNMTYQSKSWFDASTFSKGGIICQIYFPLNSHLMDADDKVKLIYMSKHYSASLPDKRMTFYFIGHADHRGSDEYNMRLSLNRAQTVKEYVDKHMKLYENYSSVHALARGETEADKTYSRNHMAEDRRVDVICSWSTKKIKIDIPDVIKVELAKRVTKKVFHKFDQAKNSGKSDDDIVKGIKEIIKMVQAESGNSLKKFETYNGSEQKSGREVERFPSTHGVNKVSINVTHTLFSESQLQGTDTRTVVKYHWGKRNGFVVVETNVKVQFQTSVDDSKVANISESEYVEILQREVVESNPLFNPPDT